MIHIIDNPVTAGCQPLLRPMFADRKRLFVDLFGWDVPVVDGHYEIDQFDTADAVYIVISEGGEHAASLRLLPTSRPHMLDTLFPHLCPVGVPSGDTIWESTRLDGSRARRDRRFALWALMAQNENYRAPLVAALYLPQARGCRQMWEGQIKDMA